MTEGKLTRRQLVFIEEYLQTWNASEAARRAGYKGKSNVVGPRLLANVSIRAMIDQRMEELTMSADETLRRITEQASVSLSEFLDFEEDDGRQKLTGINWDEVKRRGHLIKGIIPTQSGIKLELHDAQAALLAMAKRHGLLVERQDITSGGKVIEVILEKRDE